MHEKSSVNCPDEITLDFEIFFFLTLSLFFNNV